MINYHKTQIEWKIQLTMETNKTYKPDSYKPDSDETHTI